MPAFVPDDNSNFDGARGARRSWVDGNLDGTVGPGFPRGRRVSTRQDQARKDLDASDRTDGPWVRIRWRNLGLYFTRPEVRHHTAEGRALVTASRVLQGIPVAPRESGGRKARRAAEHADARRLKSAHTLSGRKTAIRLHLMTGLKLTCDTGIIGTAAISHNFLLPLWLCVTQV